MADAKVRIDLIGGGRILRALRGLRRTAATANAETRSDARRTVRTVEREQQTSFAAQVRRQRDLIRSERQLAGVRAAAERAEQRSFTAQVARQRRLIRDERELARVRQAAERAEGPGRLRRMAGAAGRGAMVLGGGVLGAGRGALGAARSLQGAFGIRSQEEILGSAVDARQNFIRAAVQGGLGGPQIQNAIERGAGIGQRAGVSPEDVLAGMVTAQERFSTLGTAAEGGQSGLNEFFDNMEFFAQVSRTTGSSMEDVVGAAGEFQRQFGLDAAGTRDALSLISEGALAGSLSLRDFAERFPQAIASFQGARGTTGIDALREFQAIAQALRAGGMDPRVARTYQENLLGQLSNRRVQGRLRGMGLNVRGEDGNLRSLGDIIGEASGNARLSNMGNLQQALGSMEAARAFMILSQQEQRAAGGQAGSMTLQERIDVPIEEGAQLFEDTMRELDADASGDIIRQRIDREAQLVAQSDELIASFGRLTGILTSLEDENPMLTTVGAPVLEGAATGLGISALLARLGGGAGASTVAAGSSGLLASSAGAGGVLGAAGTGLGAASAGMAALFAAAGLAIAGAVTAGISATGMFEDDRGRSLLDQLGASWDEGGTAFAGGFLRSIGDAFSGPSVSDGSEAERINRQRELTATNRLPADSQTKIDAASVRALAVAIGNEVRPAGAGRREEGSPGR